MIKQNKYTNESIHLANWILLSGNVDLGNAIAKARREVAESRNPTWDDDEYDQRFHECFAFQLEVAVEGALSNLMPEAGDGICKQWCYPNDAENYEGAPTTYLVLPLLSIALRSVSFEDVCDLVLSRLPDEAGIIETDALRTA